MFGWFEKIHTFDLFIFVFGEICFEFLGEFFGFPDASF